MQKIKTNKVSIGGYRPLYSPEEIQELTRGFSVKNILKHNASQNKPLNFETAYMLGVFALSPYNENLRKLFGVERDLAEKQSIAALCSLHNKETYRRDGTENQIAGIVTAIFDYDIRTSQKGFLEPNVDYAMDNCGMGGDLYRTPNVSTIAALNAAADGIPMCKHGSPGNTDSTGSSDFLEFCGVDLFSEKKLVEKGLESYNFGYTDAVDTGYKSIHLQTHKSAQLSHMNDIIGPITNPLNPRLMKKRVLGVNHLIEPQKVAETYKILNEMKITNLEYGLFVRGFVDKNRNGGIDEVSIFKGGTTVAELKCGKIETYELYAEDFDIPIQKYIEPPVGKKEKAEFGRKILEGKVNGPPRNLILANTAVLEHLALGIDLKEGFVKSQKVLESGEPMHNLNNYIRFTRVGL